MADEKLTPKQKRFCEEYLKSGNATEAAKKAGYKETSCRVIAAENLSKPAISAYIKRRLDEQEAAQVADSNEILKFYTAVMRGEVKISTHAPAGGATAIFHKSVMRFCGKLPKDDTVLCLASFGFPRRDPKAVYLA